MPVMYQALEERRGYQRAWSSRQDALAGAKERARATGRTVLVYRLTLAKVTLGVLIELHNGRSPYQREHLATFQPYGAAHPDTGLHRVRKL